MNIVLIGFRGTGKTSVGKGLAEKLGLGFIDADDIIEERSGTTIKKIFQTQGESAFRLIESDVINELSKLDSKIIAAGGGAVLKYKNIRNLKRQGVLILLEADSDTIYERIKDDDRTKSQRPPLTSQDFQQEIEALLELRKDYYHRAADHTIDTINKTIEAVVDEVLQLLKNTGFIKS